MEKVTSVVKYLHQNGVVHRYCTERCPLYIGTVGEGGDSTYMSYNQNEVEHRYCSEEMYTVHWYCKVC